MLFGLMEILAYIYYWTWFLWPFVFVFCLAYGIKETIQGENTNKIYLILTAVALMLILAGFLWPVMR